MTDSFVTQCPHCQTSFRVTRAQLAAAHGAVRCGACLHVFNAAKQLLGSLAAKEASAPTTTAPAAATPPARPAAPSPTPPAPGAPAPAPSVPSVATVLKPQAAATPAPSGKSGDKNTLWIHDDLDLDSLDLDEELAKLEQEELKLSREFMALQAAPKPGEQLLGQRDDPEQRYDEGWAEALLHAEQRPTASAPQAPVPPPRPAEPERREPALNLAAVEEEDDPLPSIGSARDDEPDDEPDLPAPDRSATQERDEDNADEPLDDAPTEPVVTRSPPRNEPSLRDKGLLDLDDEPLQLEWQAPRKPWGRWIGWGLLNLIGGLALGFQYVWYHFDELARTDQYRPWFEQLCPEIGCRLPSKVDVNLIKSSNLVVRSHPDFTGALVVDAIIYNRAAFSQPFPLLELRFADINGQLLANRRFKPGEYLGGELAGQTEMPPQTPIHISLDILDPGIKAVNYSLSFHSPE